MELSLDRWSLGVSQWQNSVVLQQLFIALTTSGNLFSGQLQNGDFSE